MRNLLNLSLFLLHNWQFYSLERNNYIKCIGKAHKNNLNSLLYSNVMVAVLSLCFMLFPILVERNIHKAVVYLAVSFIAILLAIITRYSITRHKNGKQAGLLFFRMLLVMYYLNTILFGIYLGVWSNPNRVAVTFMGILIVALFPFINPPSFNLGLTLGAMLIFSLSSIFTKVPENWIFDITDVLIAGIISIAFCWQVSMLRISLISSADELEKERDSYYNQSTIDELTQLKNRRDFTQTMQRFLTSFRSDDKWLWVAIMDLDYFKNYNDFYGHPKGDEVLRSIGRELNSLRDSTGVYAARIGGEEFALIRLEKETIALDGIISQLQQKIYDLNIPHEKSKTAPYVTISIGVYLMQCLNARIDPGALYNLADKALYIAKRSGRNCAVILGEDSRQYSIHGLEYRDKPCTS